MRKNKKGVEPVVQPKGSDRDSLGKGAGSKMIGRLITPSIVISVVFISFCYLMLPGRNSYMLRWYDYMSLFESTRFFFKQMLCFPGGLMRYFGAWLTQLMYYPWLGSTVLIAIWLLTARLTAKAFRLSREAFPLAFVVPMAMLVSIVQIDEAWLSMKSVGYLYSNSLSFLFVVADVCLYRAVEKIRPLAFVIVLLTAVLYIFAGFYALLASFIGCIFLIADSVRNRCYPALVYPAVALSVIFVLPELYYRYYGPTTVDNEYLLIKGLPDFIFESFDVYLWMPFAVAIGFMLILAVAVAFLRIPSSRPVLWVSTSVLIICGIWSLVADRKNEQLRATVVMLHHLENNNWEGITMVMSRIKEPPNYTMRVLNNFAVVNLGGKAASLNDIEPINADPRHNEGFLLTALLHIPINYYNGDFNVSYRWAMEHCVQYGKRVFLLKYLVKNSLLNGDIKLAKRYNDILLGTLFYKKWAEEMNRYIEDPSLIESNIEFRSILELNQPETPAEASSHAG
ncbi:MAG: hypothetical protein K2K93_05065 [Muribaculaceae bacterium]|nr:hypothetical protein [Muribaculaceae bacterium]